MDETVTITREKLNEACTKRGGFTRATLAALGVDWPPEGGWTRRLEGKQVSLSTWRSALMGAKKFRTKADQRAAAQDPGLFEDLEDIQRDHALGMR